MRKRTLMALFAALAVLPGLARAQAVNVQTFAPSPHARDYFTVKGSETIGHLNWGVGVLFNYAQNPLVLRESDGDVVRHVVSDQLTGDVLVAFGVLDFMEFALAVPVHVWMRGDGISSGTGPETFGMGDLRFSPRFRIVDHDGHGFGLALAGTLNIPVGKHFDRYMGGENVSFSPEIMLELRYPYFRMAIDAGYKFAFESEVRDLQVDDELLFGGALGVMPGTKVMEIVVEANGAAGANSLFERKERRLEVDGGFKFFPTRGLTLNVGAGAGVLAGYGSPDWRVFAGLGYSPIVEPDRDGDGIFDRDDACPDEPEDRDGFEDANGCPDPDNDQDGILDAADQCRDDAEDKDGFEDGEGCPDPDNDQDGVRDVNDGCPLDAEDKDGFQDDDGCPDPDNDQDGILDAADQCPTEPENVNGCQDDDGCPEAGKVCIVEDKIVTLEPIFFKFGKAIILEKSFPVLQEMAQLIGEHKEWKRIRVEGHTDDIGRDANNLRLSRARAKAVYDHLVKQGIDRKRLEHQGFGETRPLVPNDSDDNRAKNRRVDFVIVEKAAL